MQLSLGPFMVQIWSRDTPDTGINETLVLHRVVQAESLPGEAVATQLYRVTDWQWDGRSLLARKRYSPERT